MRKLRGPQARQEGTRCSACPHRQRRVSPERRRHPAELDRQHGRSATGHGPQPTTSTRQTRNAPSVDRVAMEPATSRRQVWSNAVEQRRSVTRIGIKRRRPGRSLSDRPACCADLITAVAHEQSPIALAPCGSMSCTAATSTELRVNGDTGRSDVRGTECSDRSAPDTPDNARRVDRPVAGVVRSTGSSARRRSASEPARRDVTPISFPPQASQTR